MGKLGSPEKSILNHLTPRNNPEDGKIQTLLWLVVSKILNKDGPIEEIPSSHN